MVFGAIATTLANYRDDHLPTLGMQFVMAGFTAAAMILAAWLR
jgi:hypothetical protein